jgi:integrase/recombinase XerD
MTPLRRRMIEDMKLKNLSTRTINTYVSRVYNFATHFRQSPERLGRDDVRAYLLFLIREKKGVRPADRTLDSSGGLD